MKYLGHIVDRNGIQTDPEKVMAIVDMGPPKTVKGVRQFLGMVSWYRKFIPAFSEVAVPLHELLSRTLSPAERNYTVTEKECLAIVWGIKKWKPYLEGYSFTVITNHQSLKWLLNVQNLSGRLARWVLELQSYDFDIQYRKGKLHKVPDALSRSLPVEPPILKTNIEVLADELRDCSWWRRLFQSIQRDPKQQRLAVLEECHHQNTAGHLGISKTIARVAEDYYWPGLRWEVIRYVRSCELCQQFKPSQQTTPGFMQFSRISEPWEVVT